MGIPHKHAAIIKAWADGAKIQFNKGDVWEDWISNSSPSWFIGTEYRIKPKPPVKKYLWAYCKRLDGIAKITQFYYANEKQLLQEGFPHELGTPTFHWIQRIDASVKEFPDT